MKSPASFFMVSLVALVLATPLAAQGSNDKFSGDVSASERKTKNAGAGTALVRYEVSVSSEGSRSEGLSGRLYGGTTEFPGEFARIEAYGIRYTFTPPAQAWSWRGFSPEPSDFTPTVAGDAASDTEIREGWYSSAKGTTKPGTPRVWVYLESGDTAYWLDPRKLGDFLQGR